MAAGKYYFTSERLKGEKQNICATKRYKYLPLFNTKPAGKCPTLAFMLGVQRISNDHRITEETEFEGTLKDH